MMLNKLKKGYIVFNLIFYLLYAMLIFGIGHSLTKYINTLHIILNTCVGLFLIYMFNPFQKLNIDSFYKLIAFHAGVIIIINLSLLTF